MAVRNAVKNNLKKNAMKNDLLSAINKDKKSDENSAFFYNIDCQSALKNKKNRRVEE